MGIQVSDLGVCVHVCAEAKDSLGCHSSHASALGQALSLGWYSLPGQKWLATEFQEFGCPPPQHWDYQQWTLDIILGFIFFPF